MRSKLVRYICMLAGIYIMTLGCSLAIAAGVGVGAVDAIAVTGSYISGLSIGTVDIIMNVVFILLQIAILRRDFEPVQLLQFPVSFLFGWFLDLNLGHVWASVNTDIYPLCLFYVAAGMAIAAAGADFIIHSRVVQTPVEAFYFTVSRRTRLSVGQSRLALDITLILLNAAAILAVTHIWTIREGTLIALVMGPFIDLFKKPVAAVIRFMSGDREA